MILGVDPGRRRVGVAIADEETSIAVPVEVIDREVTDAVARIGAIAHERMVRLVVVGKPFDLSGAAGPAVDEHVAFVAALRESLEAEVREHDERLTTVIAERSMRASGATRKERDRSRDAVAAQVMLQSFLDGGTWR